MEVLLEKLALCDDYHGKNHLYTAIVRNYLESGGDIDFNILQTADSLDCVLADALSQNKLIALKAMSVLSWYVFSGRFGVSTNSICLVVIRLERNLRTFDFDLCLLSLFVIATQRTPKLFHDHALTLCESITVIIAKFSQTNDKICLWALRALLKLTNQWPDLLGMLYTTELCSTLTHLLLSKFNEFVEHTNKSDEKNHLISVLLQLLYAIPKVDAKTFNMTPADYYKCFAFGKVALAIEMYLQCKEVVFSIR